MTTGPVIRRRSAYADRLLEFSDFVFSDGAEVHRRGGWHDFFRSRIGPAFDGRVIFEIGCNDAALLARVAAKFPTTAFIGIDWKCRALHTAAARVAAAGLRNVALIHGRAQDLSRMFADGELHEVWLFHPDPCDKPRELANRLVSERFLLDVHRVLRTGGAFVLKTDHAGYYQWTLGLLGVREPESSNALIEGFDVSLNLSDYWKNDVARERTADRCFAGERTFFESRSIKKRLPIHYVELRTRSRPA